MADEGVDPDDGRRGVGLRLPHRMRLRGARVFAVVHAEAIATRVGPLVVLARPNDEGHPRLGLAVPRRVGNAVVRNRIKRQLREAFRRRQHDLPRSYDVVIRVRPHEPLGGADYGAHLERALHTLHTRWTERLDKTPTGSTADDA